MIMENPRQTVQHDGQALAAVADKPQLVSSLLVEGRQMLVRYWPARTQLDHMCRPIKTEILVSRSATVMLRGGMLLIQDEREGTRSIPSVSRVEIATSV